MQFLFFRRACHPMRPEPVPVFWRVPPAPGRRGPSDGRARLPARSRLGHVRLLAAQHGRATAHAIPVRGQDQWWDFDSFVLVGFTDTLKKRYRRVGPLWCNPRILCGSAWLVHMWHLSENKSLFQANKKQCHQKWNAVYRIFKCRYLWNGKVLLPE